MLEGVARGRYLAAAVEAVGCRGGFELVCVDARGPVGSTAAA